MAKDLINKLCSDFAKKQHKFQIIRPDSDGNYWRHNAKTRLPLLRLIVKIVKNGESIYEFDSSAPDSTNIIILIKKSKNIAIFTENNEKFVFGENTDGEEGNVTSAIVTLFFDESCTLILADNQGNELDTFTSDYEIIGDATINMINAFSCSKNRVQEEVTRNETADWLTGNGQLLGDIRR